MKQALAMLEALRPPPGFETVRALGTTYSADLVACMLALLNLDGGAAELSELTRVAALRALQRQRKNVRIAFQQARVAWPGMYRPSLALLDRVLRPVPFDGRVRSFHSKVWVAQQRGPSEEERWVLAVGSRNLTSDISWDLGTVLVGARTQNNSGRSRRLAGLDAFVRRVCELMGEADFADGFSRLDDVLWRLPNGCEDAELHVSPGESSSALQDSPPIRLIGKSDEVLLVSPFLDSAVIKRAAAAAESAERVRLVAGGMDLERVAAGIRGRNALLSLNPHSFHVADPDEVRPAEPNQPEERGDRGLHAKFILARTRSGRRRLLLGSHNLTTRAWGGANCEVSVELELDERTAGELWEWADLHAISFIPSEQVEPEPDRELLDRVRNQVGSLSLRLIEEEGASSNRLEADGPLVEAGASVRLEVARVTQHEQLAEWPPGARTASLPVCGAAERTALLLFRAMAGDEQVRWVQQVEVTPAIDDGRDREALVRILGPSGFLQYLQSIIGEGEPVDFTDEDHEDRDRTRMGSMGRLEIDGFRLEALLRRFCREEGTGSARRAFEEAARVIAEHRAAVDRAVSTDSEREMLNRLWSMWDALARGLMAA